MNSNCLRVLCMSCVLLSHVHDSLERFDLIFFCVPAPRGLHATVGPSHEFIYCMREEEKLDVPAFFVFCVLRLVHEHPFPLTLLRNIFLTCGGTNAGPASLTRT